MKNRTYSLMKQRQCITGCALAQRAKAGPMKHACSTAAEVAIRLQPMVNRLDAAPFSPSGTVLAQPALASCSERRRARTRGGPARRPAAAPMPPAAAAAPHRSQK